jgi:hypothetical protein
MMVKVLSMWHGDRFRLQQAASLLFVLTLFATSVSGRQACAEETLFHRDKLQPAGERYEALVPDTLDLAERARLSVHALTTFLDARQSYAPYGQNFLNADPPYLSFFAGGPPNWGNIGESLVMTRLMSGSRENPEVDEKTLNGMVSYIKDFAAHSKIPTPVGCVMLSLMAAYQLDPNPELKGLLDELADYHRRIVQTGPAGPWFCDPPAKTEQSHIGVQYYGETVYTQGLAIHPLIRWAAAKNDSQLFELCRGLSQFLVQPKYWQPEAGPKAVCGAEHGWFNGHQHSYLSALKGLICYAEATNNARLKEFVRESYEYYRNFGIARLGLFGEGCTTGDMVFLAVKLSDVGAGDYWEDTDQYVRNHLVELQLTDLGLLRKVIAQMPKHQRGLTDMSAGKPFTEDNDSTDAADERSIGAFLSDSTHPTLIPQSNLLYTICCTGNCNPALYAAWDATVRGQGDAAQINLLLNRVSAWLDIDSYLPYEGKVVVRNKTAKQLSVRIPRWADKKAVQVAVDGKRPALFWVGQYLLLTDLRPKAEITITFAVVESAETLTLMWKQNEYWKECTEPAHDWSNPNPTVFTCTFRGNTLVDISPRDQGRGLPLYLRDNLKATRAPMKKVDRYIPPVTLKW